MYHPWQPEWLNDVEYDEETGEPRPAFTLDDARRSSLKWIDQVIEAKAGDAHEAIARLARRQRFGVDKKAFRIGMLTALSIGAAQADESQARDYPPAQPIRARGWHLPGGVKRIRLRRPSMYRYRYHFWRWVARCARRVVDFANDQAW